MLVKILSTVGVESGEWRRIQLQMQVTLVQVWQMNFMDGWDFLNASMVVSYLRVQVKVMSQASRSKDM